MTKGEIVAALAAFADDREVVLDVDILLCRSDRNILTIREVGDYHPETGLVFLDAGPRVAGQEARP